MRCFNFFCSFWIDLSVEVRNAERIELASGAEHNPLVIISNHQVRKTGHFQVQINLQSVLDLYVLSKFWPKKCTAMMKKSLKYIPFFNVGAILVGKLLIK